MIGFAFADWWLTILCMIPAAILGTRVGRIALAGLEERYFLWLFQFVLITLALKLIVWDGLVQLLG